MNQKTSIYIVLFLLVLPICYSVTLDELIDSYDYSYASKVNVTNVTYAGFNTDGDPLYESVLFEIWVGAEEGAYTFIADLYRGGNFVATSADSVVLTDGANIVLLLFDAKSLLSGDYSMMVTVQESYLTVYRDEVNFTFNNTDYEKPQLDVGFESYELVNTDVDSLNEILRVNLSVNSTVLDIVEINGLIRNNNVINSKVITIAEPGTNIISLDFAGKELWKEGINGAGLYEVTLTQGGVPYSFYFNESLYFLLDDFDPEACIIVGNFGESISDADNDSKIDYIGIEMEIDVNESGDYLIEIELDDLFNNYVKNVQQGFALSAGRQNITVNINGTHIYKSKINGPYRVEYARLIKDDLLDTTLHTVLEPYTTEAYSYDDFERIPMADIVVMGFELNENNATINIENNGDAYGFAFDVFVFDDDFNEAGKALVSYLEPGMGKNVEIEINSSDTYYIIVDYDNAVEEMNETNNVFISKEFSFGVGEWQLMSFPFESELNISQIFGNASLYSYAEKWLFTGGDPVNTRGGYWVKSEPKNISVRASPVAYPMEFELKEGWNLIAYPALEENTAADALQNVNGSYDYVLAYSDGQWISYNPNRPSNSLQNLTPFSGYWVKANQNVTWVFDGDFS